MAAKTTVIDEIADMLRDDGYDFFAAYDAARQVVKEFMASGEASRKMHVRVPHGEKSWSFTLRRNHAEMGVAATPV